MNANITNPPSRPVPVQNAGAPLDIAESEVDANGSVSSGALKVVFIFSSDFVGTINGVDYAGATDSGRSYGELSGAFTLPAINYTIAAGSARLTVYTLD